jgi:biotin transporter BioY
MLSAIFLPYRAKQIWEASPVKKYNFAGIPAVVVIGILGFLYNAWMMYYYFAFPAIYGAASPPMLAFGVGDIIVLIALYFIIKSYRARHGIDVAMAFKQLPPE